MALTNDQRMAIDRHLRKENWLLNDDLIAKLTDHYINGIEERTAQGMAFDVAIQNVHRGFGGRPGLLKMEETYQVQQYRQTGRLEWQIVRSFFEGRRGLITLVIFTGLFSFNTYLSQSELVNSTFIAGMWFVTASVLMNVVQAIVFFYKTRSEVNVAVMQPSSFVYIIAYVLSLTLLLLNKHILPTYNLALNHMTLAGLEATLQTLCIIYYIAIALAFKQTLSRNRLQKSKIA